MTAKPTTIFSCASCGAQYARFLLDQTYNWQINKMLVELNKSREEVKAGKGRILKSLKDLR